MQQIYDRDNKPEYICYYCGSQHNDDSECPECNCRNHANETYE